MQTKICSNPKCKEELPATNEFFCKDKRTKSGLSARCKKCHNESTKRWRKNNPNYNKRYYQDNKSQLLIQEKRYRQDNKESITIYQKQYYDLNKEELLEYQKQRYQEDKEQIAISNKQYYQDNKDQIIIRQKRYGQTENGKKVRRKASRKYWENNLDKAAAKAAKYCAMKLGQTPPNADLEEIHKIYKICRDMNARAKHVVLSKKPHNKAWFHVDHEIPLSKGGLHHEDNLQILWWIDNLRKGIQD